MAETQVRFVLRIPASLKSKLAALAERDHRSLNKEIEFILDTAVNQHTLEMPGKRRRPKRAP